MIGLGIAEALAERIVARKRERELAAHLAGERAQALDMIAQATARHQLLEIRDYVNKHSCCWNDELNTAARERWEELWETR